MVTGPVAVGGGVERPLGVGRREFVAIVAACQAMAASSIDLMLPAFKEIRVDYGLAPDSNQVAWIVTSFFLGIAVGQLVFGPLSDRYGRKPMLYAGLALMMVSSAGAALAPSLPMVFALRFAWGLGAAAPRSLAIAMVRDRFAGEQMARTMGLVMATFMVVPILAPSVGTLLIAIAPWRIVFWAPFVFAGGLALWLTRLPETLPPEHRRSAGPRAMWEAVRIVGRERATVVYGLAACCMFATMATFVGNIELIIDDVYDLAGLFPLVFGGLGIILAAGSLLSARIVVRVGLHRLIRRASVVFVVATIVFFAVVQATGGDPPFWLLCCCIVPMLAGISVLNANTNSAAMIPVPHVAGMASALLGATATAVGALVAALVNAAYDNSVGPFSIGVLSFSLISALCILVLAPREAERPY